MGWSPRHFLMIGWLLAVLPGCVEDLGRIHETDMPRVAGEPRRIESFPLPSRPIDRFNARALWDEFGGNALQADREYKGTNLQLTGIVRCIASDDRDRPYVGFQVFEPVTVPASRLKMMSAKEKTWYLDGASKIPRVSRIMSWSWIPAGCGKTIISFRQAQTDPQRGLEFDLQRSG